MKLWMMVPILITLVAMFLAWVLREDRWEAWDFVLLLWAVACIPAIFTGCLA